MRITRTVVQSLIDRVIAAAGDKEVSPGFPYANLLIYSANGTHRLHARHEAHSGQTEVSSAVGLREIFFFLQGLLVELED